MTINAEQKIVAEGTNENYFFVIILESNCKILIQKYEFNGTKKISKLFEKNINILNATSFSNICLTSSNSYLVVISGSTITYFDTNTTDVIIEYNFADERTWSQISSIYKTDDVLFFENQNLTRSNQIVYAELDNKSKKINFTKRKIYSRGIQIFKNTLCFNVANHVLNVFNTNQVKFKKSFDHIITCNALAVNASISNDEKYVATLKTTECKIYRLEDGMIVADMKFHSNVRNFTLTDQYLIVILSSNELLSFIIADKAAQSSTVTRVKENKYRIRSEK